jgi:hypothetical protein
VERMRTTVTALTDDSGPRPDLTVRLAALALAAVADKAVALRLTGDEAGVRRWTDTATELVELARSVADKGGDGRSQGPEGLAWLARAEAEWVRGLGDRTRNEPGRRRWPRSATATSTNRPAANSGSPRPCWRPTAEEALGLLDLLVDPGPQRGEARIGPGVQLVALGGQVHDQLVLHHGRRGGQHQHPLAQVDRLVDVVRDEQDGHPEPPPQRADQVLQVRAGLRVDRRERLVHQQDRGS